MTRNIYWTLSGTVKEGQLDALKTFLEKVLAKTMAESGCMNYEFWFSENYTKLYVFERYINSDACLLHFENVREDLPIFFECVVLDPIVVLGEMSTTLQQIFERLGASFTIFFKGYTKQED